VLARELIGDEPPGLIGYVALPRESAKCGFKHVERWRRKKDKTEETFEEGCASALDTARDVVRRLREGDFFDPEGFAPRDPILAAIGGVGTMASRMLAGEDGSDGAEGAGAGGAGREGEEGEDE
jgi:hypothetical protein